MPFFIVNNNGVLPIEYKSYETACADCEWGEFVYMADSLETLEDSLEDSEDSSL